MTLPALDRGLRIVEKVLFADGPLRYGEVKSAAAGVGDASLNRLLKSLLDQGYLQRDQNGLYARGQRLDQWRSELGHTVTLDSYIETEVEALSKTTNESVAFGRLSKGAIRIVRSLSCQDSISVVPPGGVVNFESDHAGALAILGQLGATEQKRLVASPRSAIKTFTELTRALKQCRNGGVYTDRSRARAGVSRMAVPVGGGATACCLFYCLTTERMLAREEVLTRELLKRGRAIEARMAG
jgi:DNA-binding IclR family transcriptional regulator